MYTRKCISAHWSIPTITTNTIHPRIKIRFFSYITFSVHNIHLTKNDLLLQPNPNLWPTTFIASWFVWLWLYPGKPGRWQSHPRLWGLLGSSTTFVCGNFIIRRRRKQRIKYFVLVNSAIGIAHDSVISKLIKVLLIW